MLTPKSETREPCGVPPARLSQVPDYQLLHFLHNFALSSGSSSPVSEITGHDRFLLIPFLTYDSYFRQIILAISQTGSGLDQMRRAFRPTYVEVEVIDINVPPCPRKTKFAMVVKNSIMSPVQTRLYSSNVYRVQTTDYLLFLSRPRYQG